MDWQNESYRNFLLALGFVLFMLAVAISATAAAEQKLRSPEPIVAVTAITLVEPRTN
jgi:hypothetical protein